MAKTYKAISFNALKDETIIENFCGCTIMPKCGSYGAHTLKTASGKEFVIWTSMGEVCLNIIEEK